MQIRSMFFKANASAALANPVLRQAAYRHH